MSGQRTVVQKIIMIVTLSIYLGVISNHYFGWHLLGVAPQMLSMIGIFSSSLLLWLFVAIDWPSLLCLLAMAMLPEVGFATILPLSFGNVTFAFLFFTFILTYALEQTYFIKRLTGKVLHSKWAQRSPWALMIAFYSVMLLISCIISPTILFMIAYPIYEEICTQFNFEKGNRNASMMLVALFSTIAIGTAMTPINHVFAITAIGLYNNAFDSEITSLSYMLVVVPVGLSIFLSLLASLKWVWRLDLSTVSLSTFETLSDVPETTKREKWIVAIFMIVVAFWIAPEMLATLWPALAAFSKSVGIAFPPLFGIVLLGILTCDGEPLLDITKAIRTGVHWPSLLLVSATLALGSMIAREDSGIVTLLNDVMTPILVNLPAMIVVLIFVVWAGIQTNFSSNLVTVSVVTSIAIALAQSNVSFVANPAIITCFIGFMASIALMTPPAMPYVAISVGSNWVGARQAFLYGLWLVLISMVMCMLIGYPIGIMIF
ncbi:MULTISPECIES: SLC13 family permease [unclassified Facklamia]|uniref:SLC13 family permease n=1 Tax=Aerococcaceae TaxID=186827 RepID=UPI0013BE4614|nr:MULTISPECIES: SLC13 family permease [unclassified Facklamia]NEW64440.1 SLC13 family permease [Facklamia sp. 252]NEW67647.1 SLC13 family permease [Facklamia sp. 253]QQD65627.1 SLC13 family permease [Aerococcaceae bacterium zg-252]